MKDSARVARTLLQLGSVATAQRDSLEATRLYAEAIGIAHALQDTALEGSCLNALGTFFARTGNFPQAKSLLIRSIALTGHSREYNPTKMAAPGNLAGVFVQEGKFDSAVVVGLESARLSQEMGDRFTQT